jgi:hypothetical protein
LAARGGTVEEKVPAEFVERLCLEDLQLRELNRLAERCEQVYGPETSAGAGNVISCFSAVLS